jgi:hypothetical protein
MATLTEALERLNEADLSPLRAKLDGLRADIEAALNAKGKVGSSAAATSKDIQAAAKTAGVSVEDFLAALEWAKKMGLI